jgi:hypothetical protein
MGLSNRLPFIGRPLSLNSGEDQFPDSDHLQDQQCQCTVFTGPTQDLMGGSFVLLPAITVLTIYSALVIAPTTFQVCIVCNASPFRYWLLVSWDSSNYRAIHS